MNYEIIKDKDKLLEFIDWLPDLEKNEKYYLALFARKKYNPIIPSDKSQVKRFISNKERMFEKILQLETALGSYSTKGIKIPQDSLALYINPNPRDLRKATFNMGSAIMKILQKDFGFNIHAEALSCIQQSKSKSHFLDFDIDETDVDLGLLENILPRDCYDVLQTRGGFHILVNTRKAPKTKWVMEIRETYKVDQVGDQLIPVPGTNQGCFIPKFI